MSSSSTVEPSTSTPTTSTSAGQVVVVTRPVAAPAPPPTESSHDKKGGGGGSNTAGIVAGVVVGGVGLIAIIGAVFFVLRYKKRKAIEDEYRRNAMLNNYPKTALSSTGSDSRFDGVFMAERRQSNGSIDDDQDFSRRILQVRVMLRLGFWR